MNKWTVHVTDFGKIEKADIQVAPLTLFVGDNNSGKSYMMTLIYGLLYLDIFFQRYEFNKESKAYQKAVAVLKKLLELEELEAVYVLETEEVLVFQELLNEVLRDNKEQFLKSLFNRDMQIGDFWIEFAKDEIFELEIDHNYIAGDVNITLYGREKDGTKMTGYGMDVDGLNQLGDERFFLTYIMQYLLKKDFENMTKGNSVYFPTARTGFLLTYKTLVGSAMQDKFNLEDSDKNLLTRPNSDFLTRLSSMTRQRENEKYQDIVNFIEQHVINGHITVSELPTQDILYIPEGGKKELPMYVTSGVVTELTPILLFLQYENIRTLLIEEPEISLHPELQWQMARVLIRLKNAGVPVFVTTHSDIILQHINNMIKISDLKDKEAFLTKTKYEQKDLLKRDEVAVYQFDVKDNQKTQVTKLICGDYGFEAMTFYHTLERLNQEICEIENMEESCFEGSYERD